MHCLSRTGSLELGCWFTTAIGLSELYFSNPSGRKRNRHGTDAMVLAVPPEGTRAKTRRWKTGFYHIAHSAGVPIVFSVLDYGQKTIRISGMIDPCGDYEADFAIIKRIMTVRREGKRAV